MLPSFPRFSRASGKTAPVFANEIAQQLAWLTEQAKATGYQDVDDLVANNLVEFMKLAKHWREQQSLHRRPSLFKYLQVIGSSLSIFLSRVLRTVAVASTFQNYRKKTNWINTLWL